MKRGVVSRKAITVCMLMGLGNMLSYVIIYVTSTLEWSSVAMRAYQQKYTLLRNEAHFLPIIHASGTERRFIMYSKTYNYLLWLFKAISWEQCPEYGHNLLSITTCEESDVTFIGFPFRTMSVQLCQEDEMDKRTNNVVTEAKKKRRERNWQMIFGDGGRGKK
jgi:hypothetical protein